MGWSRGCEAAGRAGAAPSSAKPFGPNDRQNHSQASNNRTKYTHTHTNSNSKFKFQIQISNKQTVKCYLSWLGHETAHFNVGNYRRRQKVCVVLFGNCVFLN